MNLVINSWWGGGKSVLFGLLDGHSKIISSPIHDTLCMLLFQFKNDEKLRLAFELKNIDVVRKYLANYSHYFAYEVLNYNGQIDYDFGPDLGVVYHKFPFDFYEFDKYWVKQLYKEQSKWNFELILAKIYEALMIKLYPMKTHFIYQMGMGSPNIKSYEYGIEHNNVKILNVVRSAEDILAVRLTRKPNAHVSMNNYSQSLKQILKTNEIEGMVKWVQLNQALEEKFPGKIKNVSFDNLMNNQMRPTIMREIFEFLNLEHELNNEIWTVAGCDLRKGNRTYLDTIYSDRNLLNKNQLRAIELELIRIKLKLKLKNIIGFE